jgi:hypothetical protein
MHAASDSSDTGVAVRFEADRLAGLFENHVAPAATETQPPGES